MALSIFTAFIGIYRFYRYLPFLSVFSFGKTYRYLPFLSKFTVFIGIYRIYRYLLLSFLFYRAIHPNSFFKMQKEDNEVKEKQLQSKKDAEDEWEKSTSIRGYFGPLNKNKRLEGLSQPSMTDYAQAKKWPPQSEQQLEFDTIITLGLALSNLPFSVIESEGFKLILNYLCPRANLKSPRTLSTHKLPMIYKNLRKEVKETIEKDIPSCDMVALTTDGWTARNGDPFVSLTLHYVDAMYELKKLTLDCQNFIGRHTGSLLGQGLDHMIARFPALTRDNLHKVCVHFLRFMCYLSEFTVFIEIYRFYRNLPFLPIFLCR